MENRHYLAVSELPVGFIYPAAYRALVDACPPDVAAIPGLPPWIFSGNLAWAAQESLDMFGLALVPFAQAVQQDLLAYFVADGGSRVVLANPWESDERFRYYREFPGFDAWLDFARSHSADFLVRNPERGFESAWFRE
ncbi:hypothetical protein RDV84_14405 [Lysobacter yananisis]|uniref:DUF4123 domain-containing protein n=1 Tax=Lysobacter yananisis TaxID=1003114 RepID=A0ABY9P2K3_9GAMM|nr:hypothetical protein [Lysobacter yananisis]WMT01188.1 hypothetical protein RDV84_14405 [Lysobacter yananisis]